MADAAGRTSFFAAFQPFDNRGWRAGDVNPLEPKLRKCTMQSATNFCRLPGRYGYKWPALQE